MLSGDSAGVVCVWDVALKKAIHRYAPYVDHFSTMTGKQFSQSYPIHDHVLVPSGQFAMSMSYAHTGTYLLPQQCWLESFVDNERQKPAPQQEPASVVGVGESRNAAFETSIHSIAISIDFCQSSAFLSTNSADPQFREATCFPIETS